MNYYVGNAWDLYNTNKDAFLCVLTSGALRSYHELVMSKGIALEAKQRFPELPNRIGKYVSQYGNLVHVMSDIKLISFPTKNHWSDFSDIRLIKNSADQLAMAIDIFQLKDVILPAPGIGNGGLLWGDVKPCLFHLKHLPVTIVSFKELE